MGGQSTLSRLENELMLIEKAKTDDESFGILYDFYFSRIYFFVLKRTGQKETAEDIVSAVFTKVFVNIKKFKPKNDFSFGAWLFRIASNEITDHYRRAGKIKTSNIDEMIDVWSDEKQNVEGSLISEQDRELTRQVLSSLPAKDREVLQLKFYEELSNIEIAEVLKISTSHTGVMLHRALKKFRLSYQKYAK